MIGFFVICAAGKAPFAGFSFPAEHGTMKLSRNLPKENDGKEKLVEGTRERYLSRSIRLFSQTF